MDLFIVSVTGPPGSGKSKFCAAFGEYLTKLGRNVKYINLDTACEVFLAFTPDWNVTDHVKVSEIMKTQTLGFNGALLRSMEIMEQSLYLVLDEMSKYPPNTFIMMDMPGQVTK